MAAGGARNRSGPAPDPNSGRSERRGVSLTALPASYEGMIPEFPLPGLSDREHQVWVSTWRLPQGSAWSLPSESWRVRSVAMWVRLAVRCEEPDASASLLAQLHRFADQIGMTTAGLAEMGWQVAVDEVAQKASERPERSQERRLRVASGDAQ